MDQLFDVGKKFLSESMQQQGQGQQQHHQQQQQYGQDQQHHGQQHHEAHGGNYPAGGGYAHDDDWSNAHEEAARHSGGSHSSSFFSNVVGAISDKKGTFEHEQIDEHDAIRKHQQVYDDDHVADGSSLGTAAAMNVLKNFVGGGSSQPQSQSGFMGMAMSEASKLFDSKASQGKVQSGTTKDSVMQQAGEMAVKMWMQSQGKQSGGASGLLSLASKFM
ncbi:hypothetical protein ESCO_000532 [Escovopsis weberi]|uniref:DUF7721 domain-containing protein n=1 Tax=Escovopsis weberi TaxID=150374 RepID=A0A0M9VT61_ESCWE|nr:hypothetical protein ESCO_000532 [Escovopsis weberi]